MRLTPRAQTEQHPCQTGIPQPVIYLRSLSMQSAEKFLLIHLSNLPVKSVLAVCSSGSFTGLPVAADW